MEKNLAKLGPFRVRDKKRIFKQKIGLFKELFRGRDYKFLWSCLLNFNAIYFIMYDNEAQAKEAVFLNQRAMKNKKLLARHMRLWELKHQPVLGTLLRSR